jgi:hypothetical protein
MPPFNRPERAESGREYGGHWMFTDIRHPDRNLAGPVFDGLDLTLPYRSANVDHPSFEIQVIRLQCKLLDEIRVC